MPTSQLVNLKSDLKSLKYGYDRPNGGSSEEPFIQVNPETGAILRVKTNKIATAKISDLIPALVLGSPDYREKSTNQDFRVGGFLNTVKGESFLLNRSLFLIDRATGLSASGVPLAPNQLLTTAIQRGKAALGLSQTNINYNRALGASDKYFTDSESRRFNDISAFSTVLGFSLSKPKQIDQYPQNVAAKLNRTGFTSFLNNLFAPQNSPQNKRYSNAIKAALNEQKSKSNYNIYGDITAINKTIGASNGELTNAKSLQPNSSKFPTYTNKGETLIINQRWNYINRDTYIGSGDKDQINLTPILDIDNTQDNDFSIKDLTTGKAIDLVNFRIYAIDSNDYTQSKLMIFRAYITEFSDSTNATWGDIRYAGRGEPFFIYNGFTRAINIGFKVAALSAEEMTPMYQKLNFLMGNVMPDYGENGLGPLMKGPFVKMTVGNWINRQEGILKDVNYTISNDSPWEVGFSTNKNNAPLVLPHVVDVKLTFNPIGSNTEGANKIPGKSTGITHIGQKPNPIATVNNPTPPSSPGTPTPGSPNNPNLPLLPSVLPSNPFTFQPLGPF